MIDGSAPPDSSFALQVAGGVTTLRVQGDLDLSTLEQLSAALRRAVSMTASEMVVDLSDCGFLCSRSLGLIEAAAFELRERRARLVIRGEPPSFDLLTTSVGTYLFDVV